MMIYVITDPDGKIVGTLRPTESKGDFTLGPPIPQSGQNVHQLEFPKELEKINDPDQLHRQLAQLLEDKTDQDQDLVS